MKETDIRKYAELMKELGLSGLEITEDKNSSKVRLERSVSAPVKETACSIPEPCSSTGKLYETADCIRVTSPIVGVFYAAPAENADPYVSIGDTVTKGQTLGIVEAMKLMNEIVAEDDGVVLEICVTNGQVVEYGTELFRIGR